MIFFLHQRNKFTLKNLIAAESQIYAANKKLSYFIPQTFLQEVYLSSKGIYLEKQEHN